MQNAKKYYNAKNIINRRMMAKIIIIYHDLNDKKIAMAIKTEWHLINNSLSLGIFQPTRRCS